MSSLQSAATRLAELLERENAALARFDLAEATALLPAKREALSIFEAANREEPGSAPLETMRALALRLRGAAAQNRKLLERAMAAQQHIMSLLAHAARQSNDSKSYGAKGAYIGRPGSAFALQTRA